MVCEFVVVLLVKGVYLGISPGICAHADVWDSLVNFVDCKRKTRSKEF